MATLDVVKAIAASGLTIYDALDARPDLFIDIAKLESLLNGALIGLDLNYPLRTRSKVLKTSVCAALGYPVPTSFRRTEPRFPGQNFDTHVQKANNLQIWNQQVAPLRRYVLIRVNDDQIVTRVKVVTGEMIAKLDTTGTLTTKYQARSRNAITKSQLVSRRDTPNVIKAGAGGILGIRELYGQLQALVGTTIHNPGIDQERNRGAGLHEAICKCLKGSWSDSGQFPDIPEQLLEVKLQTAPTIDLGLVSPDSTEGIAALPDFRHCDVRYCLVYGTIIPAGVRLDHLILTTGADFFKFFQKFAGKVRNAKLQIPLPAHFFD